MTSKQRVLALMYAPEPGRGSERRLTVMPGWRNGRRSSKRGGLKEVGEGAE